MAQTCFGSSGHFWPMRRPLFQARCFGVVAGSCTLGISCPPYLPPNPNVGTAPTMDYGTICDDCFVPIMKMYHAACASDRLEPKVPDDARRMNGRFEAFEFTSPRPSPVSHHRCLRSDLRQETLHL